MGSGMQVKDCPSCDGSGDFIDIDSKGPVTTTTPVTLAAIGIDKRSKGYKQAIDKIMALDSSLTRDDAVKYLQMNMRGYNGSCTRKAF